MDSEPFVVFHVIITLSSALTLLLSELLESDELDMKFCNVFYSLVVRRRYLEGPLAFCCEFPLLFCTDVWSMLCIFGNADVNCWDAIMLALILGTSHPNDD